MTVLLNDAAMNMTRPDTPAPLTWSGLLVLFAIPAALNLFACAWAIPAIASGLGWPSEAAYFLAVGALALAPIFVAALVLGWRELDTPSLAALAARLRVRPLDRTDWAWTVSGFIGLCLASLVLAKWVLPVFGLNATPFFFQNMPLDAAHFWLFAVWPLFFFFNIFGEELFWRGYILPRQEGLNGRWTFAVHGALWAIWHLPMGIGLVVSALPTLFILPAIAQIRRNTSITLIIHAVFGAMGFLVLAFGVIS